MNVVAAPLAGQRRIVEQPSAGHDLGEILVVGLGVHGNHEVDAVAAGEIALLAHADLIPGRQALDVRWEDVFRTDGDTHAEYGLREHGVRACRSGAVHGRKFADEIVDPAHVQHTPSVSRCRHCGGRGTPSRPAPRRRRTSACPRRRSDSAPRTTRSADTDLRPWP